MANVDTPLMKKILHITERKRKTNVQYEYKLDDFRARYRVAELRMFCHSRKLQPALQPLVMTAAVSRLADLSCPWSKPDQIELFLTP